MLRKGRREKEAKNHNLAQHLATTQAALKTKLEPDLNP
jgi:hypothetical protein